MEQKKTLVGVSQQQRFFCFHGFELFGLNIDFSPPESPSDYANLEIKSKKKISN